MRLLHARADLLRRRVARGRARPTRVEIRELMSGNLCRCGAYTNITDAIEEVLRRPRDEPFRLCAGTVQDAMRPSATRRQGARRRHESHGPHQVRRGSAVTRGRYQPAAAWTHRSAGRWRVPARRARSQCRRGDHDLVLRALRSSPRRSLRARPPSFATWPRQVAISSSARAAPISTTLARPATNASPVGVPGHRRGQPNACHPRHERPCIATHPSDLCVALAALEAG